MKTLIYVLALCLAAMLPLAGEGNEAGSLQGVSRELARHRAATVSDLRYEIAFDIPEDRQEPVTGFETVRFDYRPTDRSDLLLDFRQSEDYVRSVTVNGAGSKAVTLREGHICIPADMLKKGQNEVTVAFRAGERSLNRREDLVYTLFVPDRASTVFPCFDQPDMKASYTLTLTVPETWKAVGNSPVETESTAAGRHTIRFAPTEPLSTYLFAFAAGDFQYEQFTRDGTTIGAYYRETDTEKVAQLPQIADEVLTSLRWQEEFTGRPYPFAKYDLVILPGFQFGGMEHTGATFYNDNTLFLPANPTPDQRLKRSQLIAHETTHMWFGDYVTMRWFDDVWTKEVFANYFAAAITRELLPEFDHDLEWLRSYAAKAMAEDRSEGRTVIRQDLDNMQDAGLIYNQIIYNKAPIMMAKLVELMGPEAFRRGIQKYVEAFPYGNATWDELVEILSSVTDADVKGFSQVWVYEKGMPTLELALEGANLKVTQKDPLGQGHLWPQQFAVQIVDGGRDLTLPVKLDGRSAELLVPLGFTPSAEALIVPNADGKGYGLFLTDGANTRRLMASLPEKPVARLATAMNLQECYLAGMISPEEWMECLLRTLPAEQNPQMAATLVGYLDMPLTELPAARRAAVERQLLEMAPGHPVASVRKLLLNLLTHAATDPQVTEALYRIWWFQSEPQLSERDYMTMAYELALRHPDQAEEILAEQRERLTSADRIDEFDYVSRAALPTGLDELFASLEDPANRAIEPWTLKVLSLLNHPLREAQSVKYIYPALTWLPDIQRTGDIFFPGNWCDALLGEHRSPAARAELDRYLSEHPDLKPLLLGKILNGAYPLRRPMRNEE